MIEIKHIKSLPAKLVNENQTISLFGAEVYEDVRENRFVYLSFTNTEKSPCFFLVTLVKEYNAEGTFIKESRYFLPNIFIQPGKVFTMEEPMPLERDTDKLEVYVVYAEFAKQVLFEDKMTNGVTKKMLLATKSMPHCEPPAPIIMSQAPVVAPTLEDAAATPAAPAAEGASTLVAETVETTDGQTPAETTPTPAPQAKAATTAGVGKVKPMGKLGLVSLVVALALFIICLIAVISYQNNLTIQIMDYINSVK